MNSMPVSSRIDFSPASWEAAPARPGVRQAACGTVDVEQSSGTSMQRRFERATPGT
jgi:hypothetical protein